MTKKPPTDEQRLISRFERAREEAPMSEPEATEFLKECGVDVKAEYALLLQALDARAENARVDRLRAAEARYRELSAKPQVTRAKRTRAENQAWIRAQQERHPQLSAHHRDLTHMSDHDLATLVEQLEELEADAGEE